ncbi:MAG: YggS family pyridoxal phosphate-dependent enzyme [Salinisphaeraceae bacterium]|nr:YggS family pyridoxal phosphate-dependent enzyme [Salinisphaeraceae bacterium]
MNPIAERIAQTQARIQAAAQAASRPVENLHLLAVSKTRSADEIEAAVSAGLTQFGENYLQEALPKIEALRSHDLEWHFIGPVQSNKTRDLAAHFDWVQSVDRPKILRRLNEHRSAWAPPLNICIQVNISGEPQKAGVLPQEALALCETCCQLQRLQLRGLMVIPQASTDPKQQLASFSQAKALFDEFCAQGLPLDTLSMGMSGDLEAAIEAGSTMLRIGTDIFGPRSK